MSDGGAIPPAVRFCWIGSRLPWVYAFAIASAAEKSGISEIVLHHTDELLPEPPLAFLRRYPSVRLERMDAPSYLKQLGEELAVGDLLANLYRQLERPVSKSDVLRAALLYTHGGIYLDLDTVTIRSLRPLLNAGTFVGSEYIVWPQSVRSSRSPIVWARALGLDLVRKLARWHPEGWKHFRRVTSLYHRGLNNAVMGASARSAFFAAYLRTIAGMSVDEAGAPFALGPDLLERMFSRLDPKLHPRVEKPDVFYPLPPEVSEHWFRERSDLALQAVLPVSTCVVHWYASVRTRDRAGELDMEYVRAHRAKQFYSALVYAAVPAIEGLGNAEIVAGVQGVNKPRHAC